jgi:hypothetical protein
MPSSAQAGAVAVKHAAVAAEPRSPLQATHLCWVVSQIGFEPEHCAFDEHSTHVPVAGSHALVGAAHLFVLVAEQSPQEPSGRQAGIVESLHANVAPLAKSPLQAWHALPSQNGFVVGHCASFTQPTQRLVVTLQVGFVGSLQSVKSRHCTHVDAVTLQRGVGSAQFASVAQPGAQRCEPRSQMPLVPLQSEFCVHCTQSCAPSKQTGSPGVHALVLMPDASALHSKHEPLTHAGRSAPGHARTVGGEPGVRLSALQPVQVCVDVLHTGVELVSTQLPLLRH